MWAMARLLPQQSLILPSAPTDEERDTYFKRNAWVLAACGLTGTLGATWATAHMAISHEGMSILLPIVLASFLCLITSYALVSKTRDAKVSSHRTRALNWTPDHYQSVDVWLPVCNEPLALLANAWSHTRELEWPGRLEFHVADDADNPEVRELAERFGFAYHVRPDRGHMKKAGNLRHLYRTTSGEFAVVFDADFCPRTDFLLELMPYFDDPKTAIVQSPQFFRVLAEQHWLERGAGAVQEFFYRCVQTTRQQWSDSAVCVGTNAIYRRAALEDNGGTTLIEHSEDVHTGFDLRRLGWNLRYVPVVLATGVCPDNTAAFMRQQYRWCAGSMSLTFSRKFWKTKMPPMARCCYLTGLGYYASTAIQSVMTPALPVTLLILYPHLIRLSNYIYLAPAMIFAYLLFPFWHRCHWGLEAWTARMLYGLAHLIALADIARGRPMGWTPTGARSKGRPAFRIAIGASMCMAVVWVSMAAYRFSERPAAFAPLLLTGTFYLAIVARVYTPSSWSRPKLPPKFKRLALATASSLAVGLTSPLASSAEGAELGITGSPAQYAQLKADGMPVRVLGSWTSWATKSPAAILAGTPAGAEPLLNWEPSEISISAVAAGAYDQYVESWARGIADYRRPVLIRFAQEMNGSWYSWSHDGPAAYVAAWRRIVTIFQHTGARNARFIWSPDGLIGQQAARWKQTVTQWYPGSRYVSYVGISMVAFQSDVGYGQSYFFGRLDFLHHTFKKPVTLPEMKVTQSQRYPWLKSLRGALAIRPWIGLLLWSETPSAAQKKNPQLTGQMNWSLLHDPHARRLLDVAVGSR
jgi:cellulose synthase (UDP-forming)